MVIHSSNQTRTYDTINCWRINRLFTGAPRGPHLSTILNSLAPVSSHMHLESSSDQGLCFPSVLKGFLNASSLLGRPFLPQVDRKSHRELQFVRSTPFQTHNVQYRYG